MTLVHIDHNGVQTEVLDGLKRKPRGKVNRLPSPHIPARHASYKPIRRRPRPRPVNDLLSGFAACIVALAVLAALAQ